MGKSDPIKSSESVLAMKATETRKETHSTPARIFDVRMPAPRHQARHTASVTDPNNFGPKILTKIFTYSNLNT